ncbi:Cation/H+ exchanger [Vigna unguiculata]|uniref:Cation/H+ exchanger n=1 Tax=Vigna unguiculata TaxID=3917 RepID=A0A4D6MED5_VIGUN|nr:Cation/H+ exchanger [Vigna unguiculata]
MFSQGKTSFNTDIIRNSFGHENVWQGGNPLESPTCLLFMQGGMLFGPSALGHIKVIHHLLFPVKGSVVLETVSYFGLMFYYFLWSVRLDLFTVLKTERVALVLAISVSIFSLVIPTGLSFLLKNYVAMEKQVAEALPYIGISQTYTIFISIAVLLTDLKILNTDIGRLTISVAILTDMTGFFMSAVTFSITRCTEGDILTIIYSILSSALYVLLIICVMRPTILWMVKNPGKGSTNEICVVCIFICVILSGFMSEVIGQHFSMGPILLGLSLPEGPPIGTSMMKKLETMCMAFLNPISLAVNGLLVDIFNIDMDSLWSICIILVVGFFVKIGAIMLPGYYLNLSMKKCWIIGLLLNGKGICELVFFNMWLGSEVINEDQFSIMVISVILVNVILVTVVKFIYDPSKPYDNVRRCTIQHTRGDSELRIMVCIDNKENLPTILNLLEASYAGRDSMIEVTTLVLVELQGRARPILVSNQSHESTHGVVYESNQIDNALRQYAQQNEEHVSIKSYTSISLFETMHDDVCRISLESGANILIMPFHKRWEIDGTVEVAHRSIRAMNIKVLQKAPCSVGILVDRGILGASPSLLGAREPYYVVVFFIGGADDVETLAYGARMARHECVCVTVVRFLLFGEENSKDRKRDSDLIDEYRYHNAGNNRFEILDEVVKDGIDMSICIRRLVDYFDLVMVGRRHAHNAMLQGHDSWSECEELGVIGDMLASPNFVTKASVLVIQQQRIRGRVIKPGVNLNQVPKDQPMHNVPTNNNTLSPSCTILVDKHDKM